jgi:hypothetical protein
MNIWNAVRNHRPEAAREAMVGHIDFTWAELARRDRHSPGAASQPFGANRRRMKKRARQRRQTGIR